MPLNLFNYTDPEAAIVQDESRVLADLTDAEWDDFIATLEHRSFPAGARVLEAGESERVLYILASGSVDVMVDKRGTSKRVAVIPEGSVFGEMAFFDGAPRSATIVAREPIDVLALDQDTFEHLCAWRPRIATRLLMDLGRILSARIRRLNRSF